MRLNLHARIEIAAIGLLLLGSCKESWETKLDYADVNARNALYRVDALEGRVEAVERRLKM